MCGGVCVLCRHRKRPCKHLGNLMESAKSIVALSAVPFSDMTPPLISCSTVSHFDLVSCKPVTSRSVRFYSVIKTRVWNLDNFSSSWWYSCCSNVLCVNTTDGAGCQNDFKDFCLSWQSSSSWLLCQQAEKQKPQTCCLLRIMQINVGCNHPFWQALSDQNKHEYARARRRKSVLVV